MDAIYTDDEAAREHLEKLLWPEGPTCPKCGTVDNATLLKGKSTRAGVYKCKDCLAPFTVTVGTIYERSHIPLHKWVYATHLMTASKKGISAAQLHRMLDFGSYRTAWFMAHRIREAMAPAKKTPMGGAGKIVEADETYYGKVSEPRTETTSGRPFTKGGKSGPSNKRPVVALVERGGSARVFHVANADKETVAKIITENVDPASRLHTDESRLYTGADAHTATHETVKHSAKEYARGDVHTNSAEGFFGVFKKGMTGVYQHCGEKYLVRYLTEFEFRHNTRAKLGFNDGDRATLATKGAKGKRLTLRQPKGFQAPA
jgi:transposase-like protein